MFIPGCSRFNKHVISQLVLVPLYPRTWPCTLYHRQPKDGLYSTYLTSVYKGTSTRFATSIKQSYFHLPCPLCRQNVALDHPDSFYILPLQPPYARVLSAGDWVSERKGALKVMPDLNLGSLETYPTLDYRQRALLVHQRCYKLVGKPTSSQLYCLIDVVEPTIVEHTLPPASEGGAFCPPESFFSAAAQQAW